MRLGTTFHRVRLRGSMPTRHLRKLNRCIRQIQARKQHRYVQIRGVIHQGNMDQTSLSHHGANTTSKPPRNQSLHELHRHQGTCLLAQHQHHLRCEHQHLMHQLQGLRSFGQKVLQHSRRAHCRSSRLRGSCVSKTTNSSHPLPRFAYELLGVPNTRPSVVSHLLGAYG